MARIAKKKEVVAAAEKPVKKSVKKVAVKKEKTAVKKISKVAKEVKILTNGESYLIIDYPIENDIIRASGHYAIRMGASHDGYVEISFNGGEWVPARFSDGYWWFDWVYFTPGEYTLAARMIGQDGQSVIETSKRKYTVC